MTPTHLTKWRPEYIERLREHMQEGYSFQSFSGVVRVNNGTLYRWLKDYPAFKQTRDSLQKPRVKKYG